MAFVVEEAGCLIWVAPMSFGGLTPDEVGRLWMDEPEKIAGLVRRGAMKPMGLYQDDGYLVRFVLGELTEQEKSEWTGRVRWKLAVPCGQVLVSGTLSDDFADELTEIKAAEDRGSYMLGCHVGVPPGEYLVEVYGYPPGDLSGSWLRISSDLLGCHPDIEPEAPWTSSAPVRTRCLRPGSYAATMTPNTSTS